MAKIIAPLFSISAQGKIGGTLNYKKWLDVACVRYHRKPKFVGYRDTEKQNFYTQYFSDLVKTWQMLNASDKLWLDLHGKLKHQSGFNFYINAQILKPDTYFGVARYGFSELGDLTP